MLSCSTNSKQELAPDDVGTCTHMHLPDDTCEPSESGTSGFDQDRVNAVARERADRYLGFESRARLILRSRDCGNECGDEDQGMTHPGIIRS